MVNYSEKRAEWTGKSMDEMNKESKQWFTETCHMQLSLPAIRFSYGLKYWENWKESSKLVCVVSCFCLEALFWAFGKLRCLQRILQNEGQRETFSYKHCTVTGFMKKKKKVYKDCTRVFSFEFYGCIFRNAFQSCLIFPCLRIPVTWS